MFTDIHLTTCTHDKLLILLLVIVVVYFFLQKKYKAFILQPQALQEFLHHVRP